MWKEKRKGFRIEGERDNERVTGKGGEGRREGEEALRMNKMMGEGQRERACTYSCKS